MKSSLLFQYALSRFLRFVVTAEILILTALCLSPGSYLPEPSIPAPKTPLRQTPLNQKKKSILSGSIFLFRMKRCVRLSVWM